MNLNEWVKHYIKEVTHSHEYEDMSQMGEDENDPQEIKVGNYQTKYFHVCPGASALYKDIESKGVDMDMAERSARLQDALYFVEEHIQRDGYKPERDYVMVANNLAKNIMKLASLMNLTDEHSYIQGHVDTIESIVKQKGLEERIMELTEENVPTDPSKWSYYKSQAKEKFDVYPSAYANAWAAKQYKDAGGGWRTKKSESVNEEKVYIDFLNKKKGFKQDRIRFNSYEDAVKWAKKNFEKFNPDMIHYESVNENKNVGHYERVGNQTIVDSNFVNYSKGVLPNSELVHLGMGDFELKTPNGNITFNRSGRLNGIGQDFVGRPHRVTDNKGGKLVDELIKRMVKKKTAILSMSESVNEAKEKFKVIDTKTGNIIDSDLPKNIAQKLAKKKKEWTSYPDRKDSAIAKIAQTLEEKNDTYFKAAYEAAEYAKEMAEKKGYQIDGDDWQTQIGFGGKYGRLRPGVGKTHSFSVGLTKNGKPQRKALNISLYGLDSGNYELTHYIN
jgi:hypothetical protein